MERERVRQGSWLGKVWRHVQRGEVGALRDEIASERARQGSLQADPDIPDADSRYASSYADSRYASRYADSRYARRYPEIPDADSRYARGRALEGFCVC
jgi:hypothetical protein